MSFYNPYMKTPDFGQGIQDIIQQVMQMMMMKQMMGGQEQAQPQLQGGGMAGMGAQGGVPQAQPPMLPPGGASMGPPPQGAGSPFGSQMPPLPPELMQMIMQMMQGRQ